MNHASALRVQPDRVLVSYVADLSEIPSTQELQRADTDRDGSVSAAERSAYATAECAALAEGLDVRIGQAGLAVHVTDSRLSSGTGQAGLEVIRLVCRGSTDVAITTGTLAFKDGTFADRAGWHEVTAVGDGTTLTGSDVPETSPSKGLTDYPSFDPARVSKVVTARAEVAPGGPRAVDNGDAALQSRVTPRTVDGLTRRFNAAIGERSLTLGTALLALLLSLVLGAGHALAPGHGKTVMAAYLVGQRGRLRQAAQLGGIVTATHTAGVLLLGLVLSTVVTLAAERVIPVLETASGLLLVLVGLLLLRRARSLRWLQPGVPEHDHGPGDHDHPHDHPHGHDHPHHHHDARPHDHAAHPQAAPVAVLAPAPVGVAHDHGFGAHTHVLPEVGMPLTWRSMAAMGVAGGLVPSPSALVVLLGATALGRAWFGVVLVVAYGAGMALTLTVVGVLLARFRRRLDERTRTQGMPLAWARLATLLPTVTSSVVVLVGAVLAVRGLVLLRQLG